MNNTMYKVWKFTKVGNDCFDCGNIMRIEFDPMKAEPTVLDEQQFNYLELAVSMRRLKSPNDVFFYRQVSSAGEDESIDAVMFAVNAGQEREKELEKQRKLAQERAEKQRKKREQQELEDKKKKIKALELEIKKLENKKT